MSVLRGESVEERPYLTTKFKSLTVVPACKMPTERGGPAVRSAVVLSERSCQVLSPIVVEDYI